MQNSESILWDKKYKLSRDYSSLEDFFIFSKINPSILAIEPYIKEGISVLEVGSGTGELISYIANKYPKVKACGLDFSKTSIDRSKEIISKFNISVSFQEGDVKNMPYESESFDIVFGDQVIGHIDDYKIALKEIYRVTKKGGLVAFTVSNSLRPDGWYLYKKLSKSHEGYMQKSMFPWTLSMLMKKINFYPQSFYGEILFLNRNVSLLKSLFKDRNEVKERNIKMRNENISIAKNQNTFKKIYHFLDKKLPAWSKVTIGILARKQ